MISVFRDLFLNVNSSRNKRWARIEKCKRTKLSIKTGYSSNAVNLKLISITKMCFSFVIRLPAAAVITAPQGVVTIIGPKASVAGLISLW